MFPCVVRFRTDYRTDLNSTMHDFQEGMKLRLPGEGRKAWAKRGIVDILEAEHDRYSHLRIKY